MSSDVIGEDYRQAAHPIWSQLLLHHAIPALPSQTMWSRCSSNDSLPPIMTTSNKAASVPAARVFACAINTCRAAWRAPDESLNPNDLGKVLLEVGLRKPRRKTLGREIAAGEDALHQICIGIKPWIQEVIVRLCHRALQASSHAQFCLNSSASIWQAFAEVDREISVVADQSSGNPRFHERSR